MAHDVYVLGGYQTDFARNWTKERKHFLAMMREGVYGTLAATRIEPAEIEVAHVGNFAAELYCKQGHLGAFFVEIDPAFRGLPTSRHEAACASGSIAVLAASAEIEAGRYDLACVVGIEISLLGTTFPSTVPGFAVSNATTTVEALLLITRKIAPGRTLSLAAAAFCVGLRPALVTCWVVSVAIGVAP